MSTNPEISTPKVFKIKRFQIALNVLLQLLAFMVLIVLVNYLAFHHYKRWDYSRSQKYALSGTTRQFLASLKKPVQITVFFASDQVASGSEIYQDVLNLLKEYQYAGKKNIYLQVPVNPYRDYTRAREIKTKYKLAEEENIVILECEGRTKFVNATDMVEYDTTGMIYGKPPRLTAFKGEQALTGALLEVTEETQSKICLLAGHGEADLASDSLSGIKNFIARQNIKLETLNLMDSAIPVDTKAILVLGPKYDFSQHEMLMLQNYWDKHGRLFVALDPSALTPRVAGFLSEQGVKPQDDRILTLQKLGPALYNIVRDVTGIFIEGGQITKRLKGVNTQFPGGTQSLALDRAAVKGSNVHLKSLIEAADGFWGSTNYNADVNAGEPFAFDPKKDHVAPLTIAASVEKGGVNDSIQLESSRMVVVGNADFLNNEVLTQADVDFTMNSLNWLLSREELIGVAPKSQSNFILNLTENDLSRLSLIVLVLIPGVVAVIGLAGWLKRRR